MEEAYIGAKYRDLEYTRAQVEEMIKAGRESSTSSSKRSREVSWARHVWNQLRMWREAVRAIASAVKDMELDAEVYVIGGAAEGRLSLIYR